MLVMRKSGNLIDLSVDGVHPLPAEVRKLLEPTLMYTKRRFLYGFERFNHFTGERDKRVELTPKRCFMVDAAGRLVTNFGFSKRIIETLYAAGYELDVLNKDDPDSWPRPNCYDFDMNRALEHFTFRERQEECLQAMADNPLGVINAATGFGKLVEITMACLGFSHAKIAVTTRRATLVNKIASYLTRFIPNVGQVGAGSRSKGRITVYTAASLKHADFDEDIVLCDEAHEMLADESSKILARFPRARLFALTASPTGRLDGTDIRMESLFGWTIFYLPYQEAVSLGLVVPIRVEWSNVKLQTNPCAGLEDVHRKRWGLWRNAERNEIIAQKAKSFAPDEQVLICVDTIEHAVHLWQHLKDQGYALVYNEMDEGDLRGYKRDGLLPEDFPEMTPQLKESYRQDFESGKLKKAISTMWDVGIDPRELTALIRADAADSSIDDIQAPGRVSRTHSDSNKQLGIVCDFLDQFDQGYHRRAKKRQSRYASTGWEQVVTTSNQLVSMKGVVL